MKACIDRFGGLVWSIARRLSDSEAEAEDAVQEVFLEIWRHASRYDPAVASETAFVAMIARRRLIDRRRRLEHRIDRQSLETADAPIVDMPQVETVAATTEHAKLAAQALAALSPEQQRILRLSIFEGLSHDMIARSTGLPMGTVKTHARRGLMRLRTMLIAQETPMYTGVDR